VALICHLFGIECHNGGTNFPRGGKNKRSVVLKFATLAKGGTELSHGGKNKCRVALICHLFGIDMPCGGTNFPRGGIQI